MEPIRGCRGRAHPALGAGLVPARALRSVPQARNPGNPASPLSPHLTHCVTCSDEASWRIDPPLDLTGTSGTRRSEDPRDGGRRGNDKRSRRKRTAVRKNVTLRADLRPRKRRCDPEVTSKIIRQDARKEKTFKGVFYRLVPCYTTLKILESPARSGVGSQSKELAFAGRLATTGQLD